MANENLSALSSLLAKIIDDNTFTAGALDRMKGIIKRAEELEYKLAIAQNQLKDAERQRDVHFGEANSLRAKLAVWEAGEAELVKREKAAFTLEKDTAVAQAESRVYAHVFGTVFRNTTIRENVMGSSSSANNLNGYQSFTSLPFSHQTEKTTD